jgi:flagellar hook-associated protein 1 FlgK
MSTLFNLLNIAGGGLAAQTAALAVTSQNVANVNTPGYVQETANLETTATGVTASGVSRAYDQFTYGNVLAQQGLSGAADARTQALTAAQNTISPTGNTIADDVNAFFTSATALESSPSDPSTRAALLGTATQLAQDISTTSAGLSTQRATLLTQAQGIATQLNGELSQIAQLNGQIAQATAEGSQPADLQSQRDALASQVSLQIGAQVITDNRGQMTLLSAGTALVTGTSASSVSVGLDSSNDLQVLAKQTGGGSVDITSRTNSGSLGGIREARDTDIKGVSSQLDTFAYNLATQVNAVHAAGFGLDGVTGRNLFTQPASAAGAAAAFSVDPSVAGNPSAIAASSTATGLPGGNDVAVQLAQLASQPLAGGQPPAQSFGAIAASLGASMSAAQTESALRTDTVTQATTLNSSESGVSLDQEMTNMAQFQNAYDASSKVLQTAQSLLQELMQAI